MKDITVAEATQENIREMQEAEYYKRVVSDRHKLDTQKILLELPKNKSRVAYIKCLAMDCIVADKKYKKAIIELVENNHILELVTLAKM